MTGTGAVPCGESDCEAAADFRFYNRADAAWRPVCERHARAVDPPLESGFLKPAEVEPPEGAPGPPSTIRVAVFREAVEALLGREE